MSNDYKVIVLMPKIYKVSAESENEAQSIIRQKIESVKSEVKPVLHSIVKLKENNDAA